MYGSGTLTGVAQVAACISQVYLILRVTVDTLFWTKLAKSCHNLTQLLAVGKCWHHEEAVLVKVSSSSPKLCCVHWVSYKEIGG